MSDFRMKNLSEILTSTKLVSNLFFLDQQNFSFLKNKIRISKRRAYSIIIIFGYLLFVFYVVCRCYRDTFVIFKIFSSICWTFVMICGVVVMWYSRKIKEAMLCIRETWIVIFSIIAFSIFSALPDFTFSRFIAMLIGLISTFCVCTVHCLSLKRRFK